MLFGAILNVLGLALSARAFVAAYREYGSGPLLPWLVATARFARSLPARLPWVHGTSASIPVSVALHNASMGSARAVSRATFPDELTQEERIARLQQAVRGIYSELDTDHRQAAEWHQGLTKSVGDLKSALSAESQRLETLARETASSDVRTQLLGLLCVAAGTVLLAIPTLWDLAVQM